MGICRLYVHLWLCALMQWIIILQSFSILTYMLFLLLFSYLFFTFFFFFFLVEVTYVYGEALPFL